MPQKIIEKKYNHFVWIDILQPDVQELEAIAEKYQLNYFQIKDSIEQGHLPKFEQDENYKFLILRAFTAHAFAMRITNINDFSNKIAFFYDDKKIITIHRMRFDFLEKIHENFNSSEEFLVHIIRQIMVSYLDSVTRLSDNIDIIEKKIFLKNDTNISLEELYFKKTQTRITKKLIQITENVIHQINVNATHKAAMQDIKDKLLQLILDYEEVLENSNNLLHTYLSINSQKSNDVTKLLTIFSAFFLPLTFLVGVYGMNFTNMPELTWSYGYYAIIITMIGVTIFIYLWFKRKKII